MVNNIKLRTSVSLSLS